MSQHTPGPWKTVKPGHGHETEYLCVQVGEDESYTTLELKSEDAQLMAAAPELLEALKGVVAVADRATTEFDRARTAIAKAEGR